MSDLQREAFELKISMEYEQPPCIERDGDGYADGYVDNAWWGWQACAEANKLEIAQLQSARQSAQEPVVYCVLDKINNLAHLTYSKEDALEWLSESNAVHNNRNMPNTSPVTNSDVGSDDK